jgi:hypothetical protein
MYIRALAGLPIGLVDCANAVVNDGESIAAEPTLVKTEQHRFSKVVQSIYNTKMPSTPSKQVVSPRGNVLPYCSWHPCILGVLAL